MKELQQSNGERTLPRKIADKVGFGIAFVTGPIAAIESVKALLIGAYPLAIIAGTWAFMDLTQIREHGKTKNEQSWYNPERIADLFWGTKGSNRFNHTSLSTIRATA